MPKQNLKDKLDGKDLDLSMNDLTEVPPSKDIAALVKATNIDLSCNVITSIPLDFCQLLGHIVKLDLSKNQLKELPSNIGYLQKLQHLDLLDNKLVTLPVGIAQLRSLKWLDLKYNPLQEPLLSVAGDCSDETQCRNCAKKVVDFMKNVQAEQERQLQKRLQEEREIEAEIEAQQKLEEEKVRQRKKEEKQAEKLKRRKEHEEKVAQQKKEEAALAKSQETPAEKEDVQQVPKSTSKSQKKKRGGIGCCGVMAAMLSGLLVVIGAFYFYCESHKDDVSCIVGHRTVNLYLDQTQSLARHYLKQVKGFVSDLSSK